MAACGGKRQLQPAKVAASAPIRSVLMHSSLEAEFRSQFLLRRHVALVVYLLSKNVKRSLSVRPPPRGALAWLMSVQRGAGGALQSTVPAALCPPPSRRARLWIDVRYSPTAIPQGSEMTRCAARIISTTLNDIVQSLLDEVSNYCHGAFRCIGDGRQ
jgi:hypothetical protein